MSDAICAGDPENVAASWAVPSTLAGLAGVVVATAEAMNVAATATVMSAKMRVCCRHSRRSSLMAQRITARRAGTPPSLGRFSTGLSRVAVPTCPVPACPVLTSPAPCSCWRRAGTPAWRRARSGR